MPAELTGDITRSLRLGKGRLVQSQERMSKRIQSSAISSSMEASTSNSSSGRVAWYVLAVCFINYQKNDRDDKIIPYC